MTNGKKRACKRIKHPTRVLSQTPRFQTPSPTRSIDAFSLFTLVSLLLTPPLRSTLQDSGQLLFFSLLVAIPYRRSDLSLINTFGQGTREPLCLRFKHSFSLGQQPPSPPRSEHCSLITRSILLYPSFPYPSRPTTDALSLFTNTTINDITP